MTIETVRDVDGMKPWSDDLSMKIVFSPFVALGTQSKSVVKKNTIKTWTTWTRRVATQKILALTDVTDVVLAPDAI